MLIGRNIGGRFLRISPGSATGGLVIGAYAPTVSIDVLSTILFHGDGADGVAINDTAYASPDAYILNGGGEIPRIYGNTDPEPPPEYDTDTYKFGGSSIRLNGSDSINTDCDLFCLETGSYGYKEINTSGTTDDSWSIDFFVFIADTPPSGTRYFQFFAKGTSSRVPISFQIEPDGATPNYRFGIQTTPGTYIVDYYTGGNEVSHSWSLGAWHHIAMQRDTDTDYYSLWIDGESAIDENVATINSQHGGFQFTNKAVSGFRDYWVDEIKITKSVRWTHGASITVPTSPYTS